MWHDDNNIHLFSVLVVISADHSMIVKKQQNLNRESFYKTFVQYSLVLLCYPGTRKGTTRNKQKEENLRKTLQEKLKATNTLTKCRILKQNFWQN